MLHASLVLLGAEVTHQAEKQAEQDLHPGSIWQTTTDGVSFHIGHWMQRGSTSKQRHLPPDASRTKEHTKRLEHQKTILKWYCTEQAGHQTTRPCVNYKMVQTLHQMTDVAARKTLIKTRREEDIPSHLVAYRLKQKDSKHQYAEMVRAYCSQSAPSLKAHVCVLHYHQPEQTASRNAQTSRNAKGNVQGNAQGLGEPQRRPRPRHVNHFAPASDHFIRTWVGDPNTTVTSKNALHPLLTGPWGGAFELPFAAEITAETAELLALRRKKQEEHEAERKKDTEG